MNFNFSKEQMKYLSLLNLLFNIRPEGKELLEMWEKMYLFEPTVPTKEKLQEARLPTELSHCYPFIREGENKFVRSIKSNLVRFRVFNENQPRGENE